MCKFLTRDRFLYLEHAAICAWIAWDGEGVAEAIGTIESSGADHGGSLPSALACMAVVQA